MDCFGWSVGQCNDDEKKVGRGRKKSRWKELIYNLEDDGRDGLFRVAQQFLSKYTNFFLLFLILQESLNSQILVLKVHIGFFKHEQL